MQCNNRRLLIYVSQSKILNLQKRMKKKAWIYIGFFVVLIAVFYAFVFKDFDFSKSTLAVINDNVGSYSFTDQNGKPFTQRDMEGKVYVAEYFFTTCAGICPKMNANMRRVWDKYKDEQGFAIVSHTCMPEVDSVPVMKEYEGKMINGKLEKRADGSYKLEKPYTGNATNTNWYFVTGEKQELYKLARQGYKIDDGKPDSSQLIKDQFLHTQFFSLVDKFGRVRGIYDGLQEDDVQKLMIDVEALLKEKVTTKRFMNGFDNNPG